MPDLALVFQLDERADGFFEAHLGVGAMKLIEIDFLHPQPAETAFALLPQILRAAVRNPRARPWPRQATLRRDHQVVGIWVERLGDQPLADLGPIGVGGIDEVDAEIDRAAEHALAFLAISGLTPDAFAGQPHGAEAEAIDGEITADFDRAC